jgi:cytochrome c oxidase subunit 2
MKAQFSGMRRRATALAAACAGLIFSGAAYAQDRLGQPTPGAIDLQPAASPLKHDAIFFHDVILMPIITIITLFVLALLLYIIFKFNAKANPVPSKTTHNTFIEILWTVVPILILVVIAIPSFRLLYLQRDIPKADMTIKVIGNPSWNWTYEYPDLGLNEDKTAQVTFTAYLKPQDKLEPGDTWLLSTDVPVVVPVNKIVRLYVTADPEGIIHAWTIPAFGMKIDAIPGRLNEDWFQATKEGVYYGQCSELCGKDHAFMPIEVHVVSQADFDAWAAKIKTAGADEARKYLFALLKAKGQLARN